MNYVQSQNHFDNSEILKNALSSASVDVSNQNLEKRIRIKKVEIELCSFFTGHDVPFSVVDHSIPLMFRLSYDSEIAHELVLSRKKCTKIVTDVLGKAEIIK